MEAVCAAVRARKCGLRQVSRGSQISKPKKTRQCPNCPYSTVYQCNLNIHILRIHTGEKPFACSLCSFKCTSQYHLQSHFQIHTGEKPFKCRHCQRDFAVKKGLNAHVLTQHSNIKARPFRCEEIGCKSTFRFKHGLRRHTQIVHKKSAPQKRYPCGLCPKIFNEKRSLHCHLRKHTGEKPFKCSECDFAAGGQATLNKHVKMQHSEVYDFPCNFAGCEAKFKLKRYWKEHVDKVHQKIPRFCCPDCPKGFFNESKFKIHYQRCHSKEKPYECDLCVFRAVTSSELGSHKMHIHTEYLNVKCTDCDKKFKNTLTMQQHWKRIHTGKPRVTSLFQCPEPGCGKEYQSKSGLKLHVRGCHTTNLEQFSCTFCSYASIHLNNMTRHIRRHTGEAPYKCEDCGKCFKQRSALNMHKHVHSKEKHFKCKLCAYEGKTKHNLKMHQQSHNPNPPKPFSCPACPYKCTTNTLLRNHSVTHRDEKPFQCQQCSYRAKLKHFLWRHVQTHAAHSLYTCSDCQGAFRNKIGLGKHQRACRLSKIKTLNSHEPTAKDWKPCFVRVVRLKL